MTTYGYDGSGRLTSVTRPDPGHGEAIPVTTFTYDATTGLMTSYTDASGTTSYTYDAFRAVTKITHPDGTYQLFNTQRDQPVVDTSTGLGTPSNPAPLFYASNYVGTQTDENGVEVQYMADAHGDITSYTDAEGKTTTATYNTLGQILSLTQPPLTAGGQNLLTQYWYDDKHNLTEIDLPDGTHATWNYDSKFSEVTRYVDPAGRETDYSIDPNNGEVLSKTQVSASGNRVTTYTYTPAPTASGDPPAGLVASITDPRGIVTNISYNAHGLPTEIIYAYGTSEQASVSYTYDTNDNPATYTDELGRVTQFTYDDLDRLIQTILPAPDPNNPSVAPVISDVYNAKGKLISETDPLGNATEYSYGAFGHVTQVQQPDPAGGTNYTVTQYGYDDAGNLTTITDPMSRITTLGYDGDNLQTSTQAPNPVGGGTGGPTKSVVYDALGNVIESFDYNGNETDYTYDAMGRVLTITGPAPTTGGAAGDYLHL